MMARFLPYICFILLILLHCMEAHAGRLGPTPDDEVEALGEIATQLGKTDWNFRVDPCVDESSWLTPPMSDLRPLYNNSIICDCSYPAGVRVCNVVQLILKGQDLDGVLPPSLVKLPNLKLIDLNRNYLTGPIPLEWASTKLENLSISANKLSGQIPSYLGSIITLLYMNLETNLFSGIVPPELGNLVNLENLILSANNLTGALPKNLTNLSKLTELEIQASGLEGPIPSSISVLSNLTELRISDLHGEGSKFPTLSSMTSMKRLMLRSCNLYGPFPASISKMTALQTLDLSFNRLEGNVPDFSVQDHLETMILTSNLLNGTIPDWNADLARNQMDLSYNNFSEILAPPTCQETLNLFQSFSGQDNLKVGVGEEGRGGHANEV